MHCEDEIGTTVEECLMLDDLNCRFHSGCFFNEAGRRCQQLPRGFFNDGSGDVQHCEAFRGARSVGVGWYDEECPMRCAAVDQTLRVLRGGCVPVSFGYYVPACSKEVRRCTIPDQHEALSSGGGEDRCQSQAVFTSTDTGSFTLPILVAFDPEIRSGSSDILGVVGKFILRMTVSDGEVKISIHTGRRSPAQVVSQALPVEDGLFVLSVALSDERVTISRGGERTVIALQRNAWKGSDPLSVFCQRNGGTFFLGRFNHTGWQTSDFQVTAIPNRGADGFIRVPCNSPEAVRVAEGVCLNPRPSSTLEQALTTTSTTTGAPAMLEISTTIPPPVIQIVSETPGWAICLLVVISVFSACGFMVGLYYLFKKILKFIRRWYSTGSGSAPKSSETVARNEIDMQDFVNLNSQHN